MKSTKLLNLLPFWSQNRVTGLLRQQTNPQEHQHYQQHYTALQHWNWNGINQAGADKKLGTITSSLLSLSLYHNAISFLSWFAQTRRWAHTLLEIFIAQPSFSLHLHIFQWRASSKINFNIFDNPHFMQMQLKIMYAYIFGPEFYFTCFGKVPVYLLVSDVGRGMGTGTKSYSEIDWIKLKATGLKAQICKCIILFKDHKNEF